MEEEIINKGQEIKDKSRDLSDTMENISFLTFYVSITFISFYQAMLARFLYRISESNDNIIWNIMGIEQERASGNKYEMLFKRLVELREYDDGKDQKYKNTIIDLFNDDNITNSSSPQSFFTYLNNGETTSSLFLNQNSSKFLNKQTVNKILLYMDKMQNFANIFKVLKNGGNNADQAPAKNYEKNKNKFLNDDKKYEDLSFSFGEVLKFMASIFKNIVNIFTNTETEQTIVRVSDIVNGLVEEANTNSDMKNTQTPDFPPDEKINSVPVVFILTACMFLLIPLHFIKFSGSVMLIAFLLTIMLLVSAGAAYSANSEGMHAPKILTFLIFYVMNSFIAMLFYLSMNDKEEKTKSNFLRYRQKQKRYGNAESIVGASIGLLIFGWVMLKFSKLSENNSNKTPGEK